MKLYIRLVEILWHTLLQQKVDKQIGVGIKKDNTTHSKDNCVNKDSKCFMIELHTGFNCKGLVHLE